MVMNHQFRNMQRVVRELRQRGYRRMGLAMASANDERVDHNYLSGFWIECRSSRPGRFRPSAPLLAIRFRNIPALVPETPARRGDHRHHLGDGGRGLAQAARLLRAGRRGLALPSVPFRQTRYSGVDENVMLVGRIAVDTLVGMIHRNERGIPPFPLRVLAEGAWHEGRTVKSK